MRTALLVACAVLAASAARADVLRLHWRGVAVEGTAPARLDKATDLHLGIAIKQLGTELAKAAPFDADGGARCVFRAARVADCVVEVVHASDGLRAERRAQVPYHDADDLAESLALMVADMLQTDLRDIVSPPPGPDPSGRSPTERAGSTDGEQRAPASTDGRTPSSRHGGAVATRAHAARRSLGPTAISVEVGPTAVIGFAGDPVLGGVQVRSLWSAGPLRLGGSLSIAGRAFSSQGFDLGLSRFFLGPRLGAGVRRGRIDFDATVGPALWIVGVDAHVTDGQHTLVTGAVVGGVRLAVQLWGALAAVAGADAACAFSREQVLAGSTPLAAFDLGSLEVTLALAYHR